MAKTKAQQLVTLKKSNVTYKLKLAKAAGYQTIGEYFKYLTGKDYKPRNFKSKNQGSIPPPVFTPATRIKPLIHVVDIVDKSTSMSGAKIAAANEGIQIGLQGLKNDPNANYSYTLVAFGSKVETIHLLSSVLKAPKISVSGMTALYQAVGETLEKLSASIPTTEKVLVKIYTDGEENKSRGKWAGYAGQRRMSDLISRLSEDNFTIVFVGTEQDVKLAVTSFGVDISNTMSYNNTGEGLKKVMRGAAGATASYSSNVAQGVDVKKGFFKGFKKA